VSGDAPRHDTWIGWHATGSTTVTVGAVGVATVVVVVVVVVVVEVGATVVVVVALVRAAPPPDELVARLERHTVSPMKSGVVSDAELRRNNRAWRTLNRAAKRVHESLANTRCVEVHCGEGLAPTLGDEAASIGDAPTGVTPASSTTVTACRHRRNISLSYVKSNKECKLDWRCAKEPTVDYESEGSSETSAGTSNHPGRIRRTSPTFDESTHPRQWPSHR
jgi:hypothetical protein